MRIGLGRLVGLDWSPELPRNRTATGQFPILGSAFLLAWILIIQVGVVCNTTHQPRRPHADPRPQPR